MRLTQNCDLVRRLSFEDTVIPASFLLPVLSDLVEEEEDREDKDTGRSSEVDRIGSNVSRSIATRTKGLVSSSTSQEVERKRTNSGRKTQVAMRPPRLPARTQVPRADAFEVSEVELIATTAVHRAPKEKAPTAITKAAARAEHIESASSPTRKRIAAHHI